MKKSEARYHAFLRAIGALNAYLDGGTISETYENLPTADISRIEREFERIIDKLRGQFARVPPPQDVQEQEPMP
jgi:hypothetical protein